MIFSHVSRAANHASVLIYHHVSDITPESTSVTPAVFAQHMAYLDANGFSVRPLGTILETLRSGGDLPDKTVAITFDDAYRSIMEHAAPILLRYRWPYTIFVNTHAVDEGYHNYLSWDELAALAKDGAEIGNHSFSHGHLIRHREDEGNAEWKIRVEDDIQRAQREIRRALGIEPKLFSYPYGEYTAELQELVGALGFFGITQKSGAIGSGFDPLAVPRFPMATHYEDMERLAIAANARPLPVGNVDAGARIIEEGHTAEGHYAFDISPDGYRLSKLACYSNDGTRLEMTQVPTGDGIRISMQLPDWPAGVRKINCTAPSATKKDVYYWYAQLWIVRRADGDWGDQ